MTERTEKIYCLYGSQTGNSEQAALDMCNQMAERLSPTFIQEVTGCPDKITVVPTHLQLDDFLELEQCQWTRLVVIFVSSYGVGQAPLGSYRFRELCDEWLDQYGGDDNKKASILEGVSFAMCGLGDSKFTTFFRNPTKIHAGLTAVGAKRVGPMGKADASGTGNNAQLQVIERWMDGIWPELAKVVAREPLPKEQLRTMQEKTVEVCFKINPDFPSESSDSSSSESGGRSALVPILVALVSIVGGYVALTHITK